MFLKLSEIQKKDHNLFLIGYFSVKKYFKIINIPQKTLIFI